MGGLLPASSQAHGFIEFAIYSTITVIIQSTAQMSDSPRQARSTADLLGPEKSPNVSTLEVPGCPLVGRPFGYLTTS